MKRRTFLIGSAATAALTGLYTWQVEPFWVEHVQVDMPIRNLPKALEGKTLMQISDLHVGTRFNWQYLIDEMQAAQKLEPDIVVYTGDFVSYESAAQVEDLKVVFDKATKGKLATLGILGNHDYGHNWNEAKVADNIVQVIEERGVKVLRNAMQSVDGLHIIGLDDCWGTNFYPEKALDQVDNTQANIVLCHNPDVADMPIWEGYQGWILAGHTHGGQCKPPFLPPPVLPLQNKDYTAGKIDLEDGRMLYINRALGHLWQVRFNVRPEITIFTLRQA